jgi:hypothetical protein
MFALKTLLDGDFDLVKIKNPQANEQKVFQLIENGDPARVALAAALADLPGWFDPTSPRPADLGEQLFWVGFWGKYFKSPAAGLARWDMEQWAGGNPSWNVGVDYRAVLARSSEFGLVKQAYAAAGLSVNQDLDRLISAPRIAPDPKRPATGPGTLNAAARTHGLEFQQVLNLLTGQYVPTQPAFTQHKPGRFPGLRGHG